MAMTPEQQKALALARARVRLKAPTEAAPTGLRPGSKEYAQWALQQSLAGKKVPQVSEHDMSEPTAPPDPLGFVLDNIRAGTASAVDAVPYVGPKRREGLDFTRSAVQTAMGNEMTPEEVGAESRGLEEKYPVADFVGSLVGPTAALAPLGMTGLGARLLGLTGSTASRVGLGMLSGGVISGGDSVVARGSSPGDALIDAGIGAGIGGAVPLAAKGAGWLRDLVLGRNAPKDAQNVARALRDDDVPVEQINQRLNDLGPDAMVMDLGPNLQSQAGAVASVPGPGQRVVREAVATRGRGATARVENDVTQTIGNQADIGALRDGVIQRQQTTAGPLYDAIRDVPIEAPPVLLSILQRPQGQQAIRDAIDMAANEGYHFPANGNVMTVGLADYIKRSLDDMASSLARAGKNNEARTARNMARAITGAVDQLEPRYRQARDAFAGPAQVLDAIEGGTAAFSKEMSPPQLRRELDAMSPSERDGYLEGARSQVEALMGNAVNDVAGLRNLFRKGWNEAKLRILLGDDVADDLLRRIDRELAYGRTSNAVASNSETARRTLAQQEVAPQTGSVSAPRGRTLIDVGESVLNLVRNAFEGVRRPQINRGMADLHSAQRLTPEQIRLLQNGSRASRPGTLPPAAVAVTEEQRRRPVEITVRGTDPLRN